MEESVARPWFEGLDNGRKSWKYHRKLVDDNHEKGIAAGRWRRRVFMMADLERTLARGRK